MREIGGKKQGGSTCRFLSSTLKSLKKSEKLEELLGIMSLDKDVIDVNKFKKLHNS